VTRRQFLAGAAVLGTAAMASCSLGSPSHVPGSDRTTASADAGPEDPDQLLLQAAVADMRALLAAADATTQAHPALDERLRPLARVLNRQLTVLGAVQPRGRPSSGTARPTGVRIPADPERALAALRHDTSQAAAARLDDTLAAGSGPFARVLSAISAARLSVRAAP
jgi:hypothetical protein